MKAESEAVSRVGRAEARMVKRRPSCVRTARRRIRPCGDETRKVNRSVSAVGLLICVGRVTHNLLNRQRVRFVLREYRRGREIWNDRGANLRTQKLHGVVRPLSLKTDVIKKR